MALGPILVRYADLTPNRPSNLVYLRLNMFFHTLSAESIATSPDGSGIILGIPLDTDHTVEYFDPGCILNQPSVFSGFYILLCSQLASQII